MVRWLKVIQDTLDNIHTTGTPYIALRSAQFLVEKVSGSVYSKEMKETAWSGLTFLKDDWVAEWLIALVFIYWGVLFLFMYWGLKLTSILIYLNLSFISVDVWCPHTLFPVGLCTTLDWLALTLSPFSPLSPFLPWFPTMPRSPLIPAIPRSPFNPTSPCWPLMPLTPVGPLFPGSPSRPLSPLGDLVILWSLITCLSFYTFPSLKSLRSGSPGYSRHSIWTWNAGKTMAEYRFLKIKMILSLGGDYLCV